MARPPFLALGRTSIRVSVELESIVDFSCHPLSRHGQKSSDTSVALPAKQELPSCLAECPMLSGRPVVIDVAKQKPQSKLPDPTGT
jgi:hypothetical protein